MKKFILTLLLTTIGGTLMAADIKQTAGCDSLGTVAPNLPN